MVSEKVQRTEFRSDLGSNFDIFSYKNTYKNRGYFLIFNHDQFAGRTGQTPRNGSQMDVRSLLDRFSKLHFDVKIFNNFSKNRIRAKLEEYSKMSHRNNQMFGMAILSHGLEDGYVYAYDGLINITEFVDPFKPSSCPSLFQKPKLFFVQACRGAEMDHGVMFGNNGKPENFGRKKHKTWPLDADILIHYATVEGKYAWRNTNTGSWFIQALCDRLKYAYSFEIHQLLVQVNAKVAAGNETTWNGELCKEMPQILSQLTKELKLEPIKNIRSNSIISLIVPDSVLEKTENDGKFEKSILKILNYFSCGMGTHLLQPPMEKLN